MPLRASASARSFIASPAWPLTQRQSISWRSAASSRRRHRSSFLTGFLSAVRQPLRFQLWIQPVTPPRRYCESVCSSTRHGRVSASSAAIAAHQLHAVVGGQRLAAAKLLLVAAGAQDRAPAAGAGIARAGAVGPDRDARRHAQPAVVARADDALVEAQLDEIFERVLRRDHGARRHVEPVDQPGEHEAQRRAARQDRQRRDFLGAERAQALGSRRSSPCPWRR